MFRSLFSLLNWSHLRETFGLICILIRPILITSQKKRLFNWAPPGFFSKHVLIYPTGNTHTSTSKSCSWHPIFLTFFTMKLLESYFLLLCCMSSFSLPLFVFHLYRELGRTFWRFTVEGSSSCWGGRLLFGNSRSFSFCVRNQSCVCTHTHSHRY